MTSKVVFNDAYNAYLIGNYQGSLKLLQKLKTSDPQITLQADILTYRIYIAQKKFSIVLDEVSQQTDVVELKLLRLLAQLLSIGDDHDKIILETEKIMSGTLNADDSTAIMLGATLFMNAQSPDKALKLLQHNADLSCNVMTVQCLLSLDRHDLAGKAVRRLQIADEDALQVQLASAFYYLAKGGEQLQEALHTYEELKEKFGSTNLLLNGQAAALIGMNRWDDAEMLLQEAMDLDSTNSDTLVNAIMVSQHFGKPVEHINRLMSQLKDSNKDHPFLVELANKNEEFTRCAQHYAPSVSA